MTTTWMLQRQFKQVSSANWQLLECFKDNLSKCYQRTDYYLNASKAIQASVFREMTTTWMLQRQFKQVSSANWLLLECFKDNLSKCHQRSDYYLNTPKTIYASVIIELTRCISELTTTWMLQRQFKQVSSANWLLLECFKDNLSKCHQRTDYYLNAWKKI